MSNVLIPLGGPGGKNRGDTLVLYNKEDIRKVDSGGFNVILGKLPPGLYKKKANDKFVFPELFDREIEVPGLGDGQNTTIMYTEDYIRELATKAFGISSITNFNLSMYAHRQVRLTWAKPTRGLWSGTRFVFKYGSMPTSETDGFMVYDSADVHYETARLEERELFVRAFNYVTVKDGRWYDNGTVSAKITVTGISGSVTLGTGAGTWIVPDGVRKIRYILVGHGGQGGNQDGVGSSGGGGGGYFTTGYMNVNPRQEIPWVVPSQIPYSISYNTSPDAPSYHTVFGSASASYGRMGWPYATYDEDSPGGNGGSGGGGPFLNGASAGAPGGSNGSDGVHGTNTSRKYPNSYARGGTGQHTSTRGFNGVLYSGGGGGGNADGGAGGGGNGWKYTKGTLFQNGDNGTDGLGGGGGGGAYRNSSGGKGGTGCIYIAWGNLMND